MKDAAAEKKTRAGRASTVEDLQLPSLRESEHAFNEMAADEARRTDGRTELATDDGGGSERGS